MEVRVSERNSSMTGMVVDEWINDDASWRRLAANRR
jgi:hypothetical protein